MTRLLTALIAAAAGTAVMFALVIGAFTASSEPDQAEAICPEGSCFVELVELLTQDPCENGDSEPVAALISPCCQSENALELLCCDSQAPESVGAAIITCCQTAPVTPPGNAQVSVYPGLGGDIFSALFYNAILQMLGRCGPAF